MLARPDNNDPWSNRFSSLGTPFLASLLLRAVIVACLVYAAWAFYSIEVSDPTRPFVYEMKYAMSAFFGLVAAATVIVGLVQYKNGTFTD